MKILFAGGGTGGHFYPIIAVAEKINTIAEREKVIDTKLFYMSNSPYDKASLFETGIDFVYVPAGKIRPYFSFQNFIDVFNIGFGVIVAFFQLFYIYPDVVFAKGGYAAFPTIIAAIILRIPIVIHESDSIPGKVNRFASRFAKKVAVSFDEAGQYFKKEKTAWIGQPVRSALQKIAKEGAFEYLKLDPKIPVILVLGGSQGAKKVNDAIVDALPILVEKYKIIHQAGKANTEEIKILTSVSIGEGPYKDRYKLFGFLNPLAMNMSAGAASMVVSRAGSTIFEIANWGIPSVIIPLVSAHAGHQIENAFNYARVGGCVVVEEPNLTPHILISEINRIMENREKYEMMSDAAKTFARPEAAEEIAQELVTIALSHEN